MKHELANIREHLALIARDNADILTDVQEIQAKLDKLELETPDPVVPWEPMKSGWIVLSTGEAYHSNIGAYCAFRTKKDAEQASKFFTFYQRLYSLAMEMNEKHEAEGNKKLYSVACDKGPWTTASIGSFGFIDQVFTSSKAAKEAADIMNRDGWELPTL